jgi:8-oxo-dGTP diphosphatase
MPIQVTAAIIVRNGKILVARRKPGSKLEGYWEFPGGKLDPNETPEACLKREIHEELGIRDLVIERHFITTLHSYSFAEIELIVYLCKSESLPSHSDARDIAHDALEWASLNELDHYQWAPADVPAVQKLIQEGLTY